MKSCKCRTARLAETGRPAEGRISNDRRAALKSVHANREGNPVVLRVGFVRFDVLSVKAVAPVEIRVYMGARRKDQSHARRRQHRCLLASRAGCLAAGVTPTFSESVFQPGADIEERRQRKNLAVLPAMDDRNSQFDRAKDAIISQ